MQSQKLRDQPAGVTTTGQVVKSARPWVEFPLSCLLAPPRQLLYMSCGEMPWPHPPKMKTQFAFNLQGLMGGLLASRDPSEKPPLYSSELQPSWTPRSSLETLCFCSPLNLELAKSHSSSGLSIEVTSSKKPSWTPTFLPPPPSWG